MYRSSRVKGIHNSTISVRRYQLHSVIIHRRGFRDFARSGIETIGIPFLLSLPRSLSGSHESSLPFFFFLSISFSCQSRPFYRVDTLYKIDPCSSFFSFLLLSFFFSFFLRTNINFPQAWKIDSESFIQPVVVVSDKFFIASKECLVWFVRGTKMSGQILDEIRFREIWSWHNLRLIRIFVFPFFSQFKYSLIFPFILFPKLCTISLKRVVKKFGRNF